MQEKIGIAADHAGFELKEKVKEFLEQRGWKVVDFGTESEESCDYPDFAHKLGTAMDSGGLDRGIAICGSGNGICMTMNKHRSVRAILAWNRELAVLGRSHNDANVLCLPARFIETELALELTVVFLDTAFEGGRHGRRVGKIGSGD